MANQDTLPPSSAPDPTLNYERSHPKAESPGGSMAPPKTSPAERPDRQNEAVRNRQNPDRELDVPSVPADSSKPLVPEERISGDMHTEEPTGWDLAPQAIDDPKQKRHPRPDGVGGIKPNPKVDH